MIDGEDMADGKFFSGGIHDDFFYQETNNLFAFGKSQGGKVRGHPLREGHEVLDQL